MKDYGAEMPTWGFTGAPLVDGNRLICLVGGAPDAKVVAFDKMSGGKSGVRCRRAPSPATRSRSSSAPAARVS